MHYHWPFCPTQLSTDSLAGMEIDDKSCLISVNPNNFPGKLWGLVNDSQVNSIYWNAAGEVIIIHQKSFETQVLLSHPRQINEYFKTTDFSSFIRQLNLYGFKKIRSDYDDLEMHLNSTSRRPQLHQFHNPNFIQGKPELLINLKRLTPENRAKLAAGIKLTSRPSNRFHYVMLDLPQENSAVVGRVTTIRKKKDRTEYIQFKPDTDQWAHTHSHTHEHLVAISCNHSTYCHVFFL